MRTVTESVGSAVRRLGIPLSDERIAHDIEFCHVGEKQRGTIMCYECGHTFQTDKLHPVPCPKCGDPTNIPYYFRMMTVGDKHKYTPRSLGIIGVKLQKLDTFDPGTIRNSFIGFIYQDDTIRQDAIQVLLDIYADHLGVQNWPTDVLFWRDHVPLMLRAGLAAYRGHHDNHVQV